MSLVLPFHDWPMNPWNEYALEERFGWTICVPEDYELDTGAERDGFIRFDRRQPDRYIMISWRSGSASDVTPEYATAERNRLCSSILGYRRAIPPAMYTPSAAPSSTTPVPSFCLKRSTASRSTLGSLPSSRATTVTVSRSGTRAIR